MSANLIKFSENSGNSGQNAQYFSQMATSFVDFPKYSGLSNQFATSLWDFSENSGNSYQNTHINAIYIFFYPKLHKCNYNTMSFLGHPVCHLGLNWCILLGLFLFFQH